MKSLTKILSESLFDSDIASQDIAYDRIKKLFSRKPDMKQLDHLAEGLWDGDFDNVRNRDIKDWVEGMYNKCFDPKSGWRFVPMCTGMLEIGDKGWDDKDRNSNIAEQDKSAWEWLKFGKIHTDVSWNDKMYAGQFEIGWNFWGDPDGYKNDIYEWVMVNVAWKVILITNRHSYNAPDQQLIHALIENVSKYYNKKY